MSVLFTKFYLFLKKNQPIFTRCNRRTKRTCR